MELQFERLLERGGEPALGRGGIPQCGKDSGVGLVRLDARLITEERERTNDYAHAVAAGDKTDVPATGGKRGRGVQVSTNGSQDDNEVVWEVPVASVKTVNGGLKRNLRLLPVNGIVDQGLSCESVEGGIFALPLRIADD